MGKNDWVKAVSLSELISTGKKLFRREGRQIVIFHTDQGVFACNNRCPHEGYPLKEGTLDAQCVVTCNWHNWKFNLVTGENLYGGDRLRTYPVEIRDDEVWMDLSEPPFEIRHREVMHSLRDAFDDNAYDRIGREIARLRLLGGDPLDCVREAIDWSYDRMEFGWTHAFAGAADWLDLYDENEGDEETQLVCLMETVAHLADDVLREKVYPFCEAVCDYEEDDFVAAMECEDESRAVAMIRGGLAAGLGFGAFERGLTRAALAHYSGFGHSLIYIVKAGRLIRRLGDTVALPLLISLVRNIVFATREDLIPEFRRYAKEIKRWGRSGSTTPISLDDYKGLNINKALKRAVQASNTSVDSHYAALLGVNAFNMLTFDRSFEERVDRPVQDNVGWLDFTHGLTFANAVHIQCSRFPELWPEGLLQMACFCGRNAPYTDASQDIDRWRVQDAERFVADTVASLFDHGRDEFIVSVHLLKTACAVRSEVSNGIDAEVKALVLAALNRFVNEPMKRKHARRTARQSMTFVKRDR